MPFVRDRDVVFDAGTTLIQHPNGMRFTATDARGVETVQTPFSIGGGFVEHSAANSGCDSDLSDVFADRPRLHHPIVDAADLAHWCGERGCGVADVVRINERAWRTDDEIDRDLLQIRDVMRDCIFRGVSTRGILPGGLDVARRARVSLDDVIETMWATAQDMHADDKETAEGGLATRILATRILATRIPVRVVEC